MGGRLDRLTGCWLPSDNVDGDAARVNDEPPVVQLPIAWIGKVYKNNKGWSGEEEEMVAGKIGICITTMSNCRSCNETFGNSVQLPWMDSQEILPKMDELGISTPE